MSVSGRDLKHFALLAEFTEAECQELIEVLVPAALLADRTLFREGEESNGLALLLEGTMRLESRRTGQKTRVGAGTAIGTLSLVEMGPRESSALTETPCEILWLRRSDFRRLVDDSPRTACRLLEAIASEFAGRVRGELELFKG